VASANGATVLRYEVLGDDTRVTVRLGDAEAVARARRERAGARPGSPPTTRFPVPLRM
jgi:hypothetical protein